MSMQVTVTLRDEIYRRAERLAQLTGQNVSDILSTTLEASLPSLESASHTKPLGEMSNAEVLALAESQMPWPQDKRMSLLLDKQQQRSGLTETERVELQTLMHVYQEGTLRKAQALAEAVRRGLRPPLDP